jgi:hypothetical protein
MALDEAGYAGAIRIEGLNELQLALRAFAPEVRKEFNVGMKAAIEPARAAIESRMAAIPHMNAGSPWIQARTGLSLNFAYVAPQKSGTNVKSRKRPNFAELAMTRAYEPSQAEAVPALLRIAESAVATAARAVTV